mgnify:CR=1 FL=1
MQFVINEKKPTICLNMIVKDESHIIHKTLQMLCKKITFSYWVICDTGSTDNTAEIIKTFFKEINIPGELLNHKWQNFAHNRTLALNAAFNKSDLLLIFDADDEIHGEIKIPQLVNYSGYRLNFGSDTGISYQRVLLVNNKIRWEYKSVIHEFIDCLDINPTFQTIDGNYYIVSGKTGNRNKDPNKYLNDAKILENAYHVAKQNNDKLYLRYAYYCANSYADHGDSHEAIKWYKITLQNNNWSQEKYMSCYRLFQQYNKIGENEKALFYLVESINYDTERQECIYHLIQYYCSRDLSNIAYQYYILIKDYFEQHYLKIYMEKNGLIENKLFFEHDKSSFFLPYYMIIVCDKIKDKYPEANVTIYKMFQIIFTTKYKNIIHNEFYIGNQIGRAHV